MRPVYLLLFAAGIVLSCKKTIAEPLPATNMEYTPVNKSVKLTDLVGLLLDVDKDGAGDIYFIVQAVVLGGESHVYFATSTLGNNAVKMSLPNDDQFQNAGDVSAFRSGTLIKEETVQNEIWSEDFGVLAIRTDKPNGPQYFKNWADGQDHFIALKLSKGAKNHYGWVRIRINKNPELLTVVDHAWNRNEEQEVIAGK